MNQVPPSNPDSQHLEADYMKHLPVMDDAHDLNIRFITKDSEMRGLEGAFLIDHHAYDTMTKDELARYLDISTRRQLTAHTD